MGTSSSLAVIDQIYEKIITLFGNDQQLFTMEFPGRVLDESTYSYDTSSIYSMLTKPQIIMEEEFRLSDDLFDVSKIVGGPNGKKLATVYEDALNMFIPAYPTVAFEKDKAKLRKWLLEKVQDVIDATPITETRMDRYNRLNANYLTLKDQWEQDKTKRLEDAKKAAAPDALEAYTRWLAAEAPVREAEIENCFADVVVSGYYHEVRAYLGYLDIKTPAEELDEAKSRLRLTGMSSLDESETIYPVQFQPADWFKSLSTDFTPEDLTMDPDFLETELLQKQGELEDLQAQYQILQATPTGDVDKLKSEVAQAQTKLDDAQSQMITQFSQAVVTIAQIVIAKEQGQGKTPSLEDINSELKGKNKPALTDEQWAKLLDLQAKATKNMQDLTAASTQLTQLESQMAAAESTDTKQALISLKARIDILQKQVDSLKSFVLGYYAPDKDQTNDPKKQIIPTNMPPAGQFMDIIMSFDKSVDKQDSTLSSGSSHTQWSVDLLFGSAGGSSDKSWSDFVSKYTANKTSFSIGFRATKVTIDRGGWFNPQFFGFGKDSMVNLVKGTKVANKQPDGPPQKWTDDEIKELMKNAMLPAYPVSFVVAKDVTLKITLDDKDVETANHVLNQSSSIGGGFLCFSASSSSTSNSTSKSFYTATDSTDIIIKIPGPQILGWFLEFVPEDQSADEYTPMPADFLPEDDGQKKDAQVMKDVAQLHPEFMAQVAASSAVEQLLDELQVNTVATVVLSGHGATAPTSFNFQRTDAAKATLYTYTFKDRSIYDSVASRIEQSALDHGQVTSGYVAMNQSRIGGTQLTDNLLSPPTGLTLYTPATFARTDYTVRSSTGSTVTVHVYHSGNDVMSSNSYQVFLDDNSAPVLMSTLMMLPPFANRPCNFLWCACL